jgi:hypothetical protein
MNESFTFFAKLSLIRRLKKLIRMNDGSEIDQNYISCAEYQLFIDAQQATKKQVQPEHWVESRFASGTSTQPIKGVSASDAEAFCGWLTEQQMTPGFRFRLPTKAEANEYTSSSTEIGCWCRDGESYSIADIKPHQLTRLHKQLEDSLQVAQPFYVEAASLFLKPVYDRSLSRVSALVNDPDLNCAINQVIAAGHAHRLACNLIDIRNRNLNSTEACFACACASNIALALINLLYFTAFSNPSTNLNAVSELVRKLFMTLSNSDILELRHASSSANNLLYSLGLALSSAKACKDDRLSTLGSSTLIQVPIANAISLLRLLDSEQTRDNNPRYDGKLTSDLDLESILGPEHFIRLELELSRAPLLEYTIEVKRTHAHILQIVLDSSKKLQVTLAGTNNRAFKNFFDPEKSIESNRNDARTLEHSLITERQRALARALGRAKATRAKLNQQKSSRISQILQLEEERIHKLEEELNSSSNLGQGLMFERALLLERKRIEINKHDLTPSWQVFKDYLLAVFGWLDILIALSKENSIKTGASRNLNINYNPETGKDPKYTILQGVISQLYCHSALIQLRRDGRMPAWEGIRIVRERIET